MESPIPILPLSTPDVDTEKLIKMKDEEVLKLMRCRGYVFSHDVKSVSKYVSFCS